MANYLYKILAITFPNESFNYRRNKLQRNIAYYRSRNLFSSKKYGRNKGEIRKEGEKMRRRILTTGADASKSTQAGDDVSESDVIGNR